MGAYITTLVIVAFGCYCLGRFRRQVGDFFKKLKNWGDD